MDPASYFELRRVLNEIRDRLVGARISNLYHLEDDSIILKLRSGDFTGELRIVPGRFLYLVEGSYEKPMELSQKGKLMRSLVENSKITDVKLIEGERIAIINLDKRGTKLKMVCEFLPKGTILILDEDDRILACLHRLEMRDRRIAPGEKYVLPPAKPAPSKDGIGDLVKSLSPRRSIVSALASEARLGGRYAEEILHGAGIEFSKKVRDLSEADIEKIADSAEKVLRLIEDGKPVVAYSPQGDVQPLPYPMKVFKERGWRLEPAESLNDAYRIAYEYELAKKLEEERRKALEEKAKELERKIREKEFSAKRLLSESSELRRIAEKLFQYSMILESVKNDLRPRSINGMRITPDPEKRILLIESDGYKVELTFSESLMKQISNLYDKAKKAEAAAKRLLDEASKLSSKLESLRKVSEKALEEALLKVSARIKPGRGRWYERYRWFISSEGFLAVAGKDASSNISLLKKHLEPDDLVFHAEIRGAAVVILKNGKNSGEASKREAAQFAAIYSRAWKDELRLVTVYYITPDQISFEPPPGHYLPRGGFIIKGRRTYLQARLDLAIGVTRNLELIYGPPSAVQARAERFVIVEPGKISAEELSEKIVQKLFSGFELSSRELRDLRQFIAELIPYGRGRLVDENGV